MTTPGLPLVLQWSIHLAHPYARYGLAIATKMPGVSFMLWDESELRKALAQAIENGLERFRMETFNNPADDGELRFQPISHSRLRVHPNLVSGNLAPQGKYLYPSIIASDKQAKGTFVDAETILAALCDNTVPLSRSWELKRSIAPVTGEINNGGKEKTNQKATLFEASCAAIATLTELKPSALTQGNNTAIFPDLEFPALCEFIHVFRKFQAEGKTLLVGKPSKEQKFRRPPIHDGNYPDAPHEAAFGPIGLLAAMGYWAVRADETTRKETHLALESLAGRALYIISYASFSQYQFSHYIVELAKEGDLFTILSDFYRSSRPYATYDGSPLKRDLPVFRLMYFALSRFLQQFDNPSFRDFLATRAEYPRSTSLLLGVYFMQAEHIPRHIVESARSMGQWVNRVAYRVADAEVPLPGGKTRDELSNEDRKLREPAVRKLKARYLVQFESYVMGAREPEEMFYRLTRTIGLAGGGDVPRDAVPFMDAANIGSFLTFKQAQQLLLAYTRVQAVVTNHGVSSPTVTDESTDMDKEDS